MVQTGTVIGGTYRILRRIGGGGMGEVYEAAHLELPRRFAVKVLSAPGSESLAQRFRQEASVTARLLHPNIVEVVDFRVAGELHCIVMELLRGEDLSRRLARTRPLPPAQALWITRQIAAALAFAHRMGVVHRDLKPQNIFLARDADGHEQVKVLDFGISKLRGGGAGLTREEMLIGSPRYMAPEQALGRNAEVDARADVFALGAVVYEMLSGTHAIRGASEVEVLHAVVYGEVPPLRTLGHPEQVSAVVARALAKSPAERYASAVELAQALEAALPGLVWSGESPTLAEAGSDDGAEPTAAGPTSAPALEVAEHSGGASPGAHWSGDSPGAHAVSSAADAGTASAGSREAPTVAERARARRPGRRWLRLAILLGAALLAVASGVTVLLFRGREVRALRRLAAAGSWSQLVAAAERLPAAKRPPDWEDLLTRGALGLLASASKAADQPVLDEIDALLGRLPSLRRRAELMAARTERGLEIVSDCFAESARALRSPKECTVPGLPRSRENQRLTHDYQRDCSNSVAAFSETCARRRKELMRRAGLQRFEINCRVAATFDDASCSRRLRHLVAGDPQNGRLLLGAARLGHKVRGGIGALFYLSRAVGLVPLEACDVPFLEKTTLVGLTGVPGDELSQASRALAVGCPVQLGEPLRQLLRELDRHPAWLRRNYRASLCPLLRPVAGDELAACKGMPDAPVPVHGPATQPGSTAADPR